MASPLDQGLLIALLNPAMSLVLATTFMLLWLNLRARLYLANLAAAYALSAFGFLLQRFELPIGFYPTKLLSNLSFAAAGFLIATAICLRYKRPVPYIALGLLAGGGVAAVGWFMFAVPDLTMRIYAMNFALGGISLLVAAELRAVANKTMIDKLLFMASLLSGLNFLARTVVIVYFHGAYETYDGFYTSLYWTSVIVSHAVLSLTVALCLIMAAALDVFGELKAESRTDPLSGLLNRRGLEDRAKSLYQHGFRPVALSVVVADLDHFKRVNDRHGHQVGDAVIAAFAQLLRKAGGPRAVVARIGGEEFAVLLAGSDLAAARLFAEGVRTLLASGSLPGPAGAAGQITCSFGVAERTGGDDLDTVMKRADDALLHAKRAGRDRVRVVYVRPEFIRSDEARAHDNGSG